MDNPHGLPIGADGAPEQGRQDGQDPSTRAMHARALAMPEPAAQDPDALNPSRVVVPGFSIVRELGAGPRGKVYLAHDGERSVALKVLSRGVSLDLGLLERLRPGATSRLRHATLAPVLRHGETADGTLYVAVPYITGDSLEGVLRDLRSRRTDRPSLSPLSVGPDGELHPSLCTHATELIADVAEGLGELHREGFAHRRLSPRNLILGPAGHLVATDLGGSSSVDRDSLPYRAPEELDAFPSAVGPAADVHALGVILFELLTRRLPFFGETVRELRRAIQTESAPLIRELDPTISVELEAVIARALAPRPEDRYVDGGALAADLRAALLGARPAALAEGDGTASTRPTRAQRLLENPSARVLAAAALLLAAWMGGAYMTRRFGEGASPRARGAQGQALVARNVAPASSRLAPGAVEGVSGVSTGVEPVALTVPRTEPGSMEPDLARAAPTPPEEPGRADLTGRASPDARDAGTRESLELPKPSVRAIEPTRQERLADKPRAERAETLVALRRLAAEIETGLRPPTEASLAALRAHDRDPRIQRAAIETVSLLGDPRLLLDLLGVDREGAQVELCSSAFLELWDALAARSADEAARDFLCSMPLDTMLLLDEAPPGARVSMAPNLVCRLEAEGGRAFTERWMRARAWLDPEAFLAAFPVLAAREESLLGLVTSLTLLGAPRAEDALRNLVETQWLSVGPTALAALRAIGAHGALLDIARSSLPLAVRRRALDELVSSYAGLHLPELRTIALTSADPGLRRSALRGLEAFPEQLDRKLLETALEDAALRPRARLILARLPEGASLPVALDLLGHSSPELRRIASTRLVDARETELAPILAERLLSPSRVTRAAAWSVLEQRGEALEAPWALARLVLGGPLPPPAQPTPAQPPRGVSTAQAPVHSAARI